LAWVIGRSARRTACFLLAVGRLPAGAVLAVLVLLGASAPASAQTWTWSVVPSPSPSTRGNVLNSVSCVSATVCTAAGYDTSIPGGAGTTLIESWNGTSWSVVPSPTAGTAGSFLYGVSCASATACTAVGFYYTSGARWTLVESWNGTSWSVVPSPSPATDNYLNGVSCVSATACTAVGEHNDYKPGIGYKALIESWNGTSWSVVPSPNHSFGDTLDGVSCVSATACTATGDYLTRNIGTGSKSKTLVESWNGTSWSVVPSPRPGISSVLYGVSCVSAAACTAVGYHATSNSGPDKTLVESWNGTSWAVVLSPSPGIRSVLDTVSCASATACTAAGDRTNSKVHDKTLIESGTASG
jgi:hypothetical protein